MEFNPNFAYKLQSKYKECYFLNFCKFLPADKYLVLWQNTAVCAVLFSSTYIYEQAFPLLKLIINLHNGTEWQTDHIKHQ
jgi:hypothetical protein